MSASEQADNGQANKGNESRIQLALSRGARASKAVDASSNFTQSVSAAGIGPAGTLQFGASAIILTVGTTFRIVGIMSGTAAAVDQIVTAQLMRGAAAIGPLVNVAAGHEVAQWAVSLEWIDTPPVPSIAQHYSIQCTSGGNITCPSGSASITVEERPAP